MKDRLKSRYLTNYIIILTIVLLVYCIYTFGPKTEIDNDRYSNTVEQRTYNLSFKSYNLREGDSYKHNRKPLSFQSSDKTFNSSYTIVIPTYKRDSLIKRAVQHYSAFNNVSKIIVVWFNEGAPPEVSKIKQQYITRHSKVNLEFYWMPNFVRLRYYPYPTIDTEAILNVDDDILVEESSALKAFSYWKKNNTFMYGFISRNHEVIGKNLYEYVIHETLPYSFLLANNVFLHRKFYETYQTYIEKWEHVIDRWQACEDIAMSFMIADLNKKVASAFKLNGKITDIREKTEQDSYQGLSKRSGHLFQRSYCLNRFAESYETFPLMKHSKILSSAINLKCSLGILLLLILIYRSIVV